MYSCQGRTTSFSVNCKRRARKLPAAARSFEMQAAENKNDRALNANAHLYPNWATLAPPRNAPTVSVVHCVVCVSELAVCNSSWLAMVGRIADRPLVKNGDANISSALSR